MKLVKWKSAQKGVGLIEVLVAVVVLAIGFLACANMQIAGMRSNLNSQSRSQAMLLAGEMMDRMRDNPVAVAAGAYDGKSTGTFTAPSCVSTGCTASETATADLFDWSANLISLRSESQFTPLLPVDSANVPASGTISTPVDGVYTITMNWKERINGTESAQTLSVKFVP